MLYNWKSGNLSTIGLLLSLFTKSPFQSGIQSSLVGAFQISVEKQHLSHYSNRCFETSTTFLTMATNVHEEGVAASARSLGLFQSTPLLFSKPLTELMGGKNDVYIKLDTLQASGSFKDRGMAHLCDILYHQKGTRKLISSSGGNAGLAVATVGGKLGMEIDVIVPKTTKALVIEKLKSLGASVTVHGENWNEADSLARERVAQDDNAEYVSPYDNPLLWCGHSTLVDEVLTELPETSSKIGAIVASVGGGGLICGILEGLERNGRNDIAVVAAETEGAASFGKAWEKGELIRLKSIDSIATSLGALEVTEEALIRGKSHMAKNGMVSTAICTDKEAVDACVKFAQDYRILVEPACGAALAAIYSPRLREQTFQNVEGTIIMEVCGGSGVNTELLESWKKQFL